MNAYLAGQQIEVTLDVAAEGETLTASAASYRVIDQDGTELVPLTVIPSWSGDNTAYTAVIPADLNTLVAGQVRAIRTVELHLTVDNGGVAGTIVRSDSYAIEALNTLVVPDNSFQTYEQAILASFELVGIPHWQNATKPTRMAALVQARHNLCRIKYRYLEDRGQEYLSSDDAGRFGIGHLDLITAAEYASLPAEFRTALTRAQVMEANWLLMPDNEPEKMRSKGMFSMTVGESTATFRPNAAANMPVCQEAMRELSKFVNRHLRIGRV